MGPGPIEREIGSVSENNLDEWVAEIAENGFVIIPDVLSKSDLKRAREAVYRAAQDDEERGRDSTSILDADYTDYNTRVWNLLSRDPIFETMAFHDLAVDFVKKILGWPALLGNISANITLPGGGEMVLHADQMFVPEPWSDEPQGLNIAWCLDDFTEENGATRIVPDSHKLNRAPRSDDLECDTVPLEASAGSIIVFESRLWHKTGFNHSKAQKRAGVFGWYTKPIYRTQENWFLSLRPDIRQFASKEALVLLGYRTRGLGLVNGVSPA